MRVCIALSDSAIGVRKESQEDNFLKRTRAFTFNSLTSVPRMSQVMSQHLRVDTSQVMQHIVAYMKEHRNARS